MKIRTVENVKGVKITLFPCKGKVLKNRLLDLNILVLKQGYNNSWHYKENGEVFPF